MSGIFQNISGRLTLRQPPLKSVRDGAILARESGDFSLQTILELLLNDPITAVSILKRANQSFYGLRASVGSLSHAVEILGAPTCLGLMADTPGQSTNHPGLSRIIRHASIVSQVSHRLANGTWLSDGFSPFPGLVATAGLLHSMGRIALWHSFPVESASIYGFSDTPFPFDGSKTELEQLQFGTDHVEIGEFLSRKMHFPLELIDAIRHHAIVQEEPHASGHSSSPSARLSRIVGTAVVLANESGYGLDTQVSFL
ncbi:MAG: HDOD domain-containing protein, partial [Bacteroidetes bacterium]|nr:HDOD domain-containing protein [Bacteroidota bacterium]